MKIDLRKDRGILSSNKFIADESATPQLSEEELIAATLQKRHAASHPSTPVDENPEIGTEGKKGTSKSKGKKKKESNRNPLREFLLLILMLAVTAYYMQDRGILISSVDIARAYIYEFIGLTEPVTPEDEYENYDQYFSGDSLVLDDVLPDEVFDELMPMTPDIEALADSMAAIKPESLYVQLPGGRDTVIVYQEYTQVSDEPVELTDDDIAIINNRSLLLMFTEMISNFPVEYGTGHLFLKRDALTITAPRGGEWVSAMKVTLDKFVQGSFVEDYSKGTAKISSKFELIMNAESDFQGQSFDALRLLDILANPFSDYLNEIVIDLARGTDDNPAQFSFTGSAQEIQYILSSWAESRSNYLIRSIDVEFQGQKLLLTCGVIFFNYLP